MSMIIVIKYKKYDFFPKTEVIQSSYKNTGSFLFQSKCFGELYANSRSKTDRYSNILELLFPSTFQIHRQKLCLLGL